MESPVISLRLEKYEDIYSDFDIRPDANRSLSVDFVDEIKRAARDKRDGGIQLVLHVPKHSRNESREAAISERLMAHFHKHYELLREEKHNILGLGIVMVTLGILCMIAATFIVFEDPSTSLVLSFLVVFLEPAAWFLLWEGMDQIIFNSRTINPELSFYRKMSHANSLVHFREY